MGIFDPIKDIFEEIVSWFVDIPDESENQGATLNRSVRNAPIKLVYGRDKVEDANWIFWSRSGRNNKFLYIWAEICEGEIDGFEEMWLYDKPLAEYGTVNRSSYPNFAPYDNNDDVVVREYFGADDQTADQMLIENDIRWTEDHRVQGVAGCVLRIKYDKDRFAGTPQFSVVARGRKVLDPRDGMTRWTENAALIERDYMTFERAGKGLDYAQWFDADTWAEAYDDCDETQPFIAPEVLGSPDLVVNNAAGQDYLIWYERPDNAVAFAGATITNGTGTIATTTTGFMSNGWYGQIGGYYLPYILVSGPDFVATDKITIQVTAGKRFAFNGSLNAGEDFDTMLDNVKRIRTVMRGDMPLIGGKYELYVEKPRAAVTTITPEDVFGEFSWTWPQKGDRWNRVTVKYNNPSVEWREDVAVWPAPGSPEEAQLLADDNGEFLPHEVAIPGIKNAYQAADLARILCLKSRNNGQVSFVGHPRLAAYGTGRVVAFDWPAKGWQGKLFLITKRGLPEDGTVFVNMAEHEPAILGYEGIDLDVLKNDTDLPDPFDVPQVEGLQGVTFEDRQPNGDVIVGVTLSWQPVDDEAFEYYDIQYRLSDTGGGPGPWQTFPFAREGATANVQPLLLGSKYDFRVRTVNSLRVRAAWTELLGHSVDADTTPPDAPTDVAAFGQLRAITVRWTNPTNVDFAATGVHWSDTVDPPAEPQQTVVGLIGGPGQAVITGLADDTPYNVWLSSIDDAGNVSTLSGPFTARTALPPDGGRQEYIQPDPPTSANPGDLWQDTDDGNRVYEYDGALWLPHVFPVPTGLALVNVLANFPDTFISRRAEIVWNPGDASLYQFLVEVWWNGRQQRTANSRDRGGSNAGAAYYYDYEDAIADDPEIVDGEERIKDGARDLEFRVYTLSPDQFTRSPSAAVLSVRSPQLGAPTNAAVTQRGYNTEVEWLPAFARALGGVVVHASTTSGFTPDLANLIAFFDGVRGSVNVGAFLAPSTVWYIRFAQYDVWGRDGLTYSGEFSVETPLETYVDTYYLPYPPVDGVNGRLRDGDLWLDESDNNNQYRWDGAQSLWIDVRDDGIVNALIIGTGAQATADRKVRTFLQGTPPANPEGDGDLWIDDSDGNRIYRYTGEPPSGLWLDAQDYAIFLAQQTADTAESKADTADSKADAAQGTADTALSDANNIDRPQVIPGRLVAEHWVTFSGTTFPNPVDGVGGNTNIGDYTITTQGTNVAVSANIPALVSQYAHNGDMTDVPFVRGEVLLENITTGSAVTPMSPRIYGTMGLQNPPDGNGDSIFEATMPLMASTDYPGVPVVNEGDSVRVALRGIYYRGNNATLADFVTFIGPVMHIMEFNNV